MSALLAAPSNCTQAYHDLLRSDSRVFHDGTLFLGYQQSDWDTLVLGRCRRCDSTLAIEINSNAVWLR